MKENLVAGINAVSEALNSEYSVNRVYIAKETRGRRLQPIVDRAKELGVRVDIAPQAKLNDLAGTREHQGVLAFVAPIALASLDRLLQHEGPGLVLVADRIQHARNLGMLIRTALGAGAIGVVISTRESAAPDDTVLRASAGTMLRIPIVAANNLPQALRKLKEADFWVYGLAAEEADDLDTIDWPDRVALVVGNETTGLRPAVRKACDAFASIPLENDLDSLNVAVAGGIAMFAARKKTS